MSKSRPQTELVVKPVIRKNPLAVAFGEVLRRLRNERSNAFGKELAKQLDISDSNYRMLESGSTNLQPARVLRLKAYYPELNVQALASFLVFADYIWSPPPTEIGALSGRLDSACDYLPGIREVAEAMRIGGHEILATHTGHFDHSNITYFLEKFLKTDPAKVTTNTASVYALRFQELSARVSPILLDSFFDVFKSVAGLKMRFTARELYEFEDKNADRFTEVFAVIHDASLFVEPPVYGNSLGYRYIFSESFKQLTVFVLKGSSAAKIKAQFRDALLLVFSQQSPHFDIPKLDNAMKKVRIIHADEMAGSDAENEMNKILRHGGASMKHFWLYLLKDTQIGFIDNAEKIPAKHSKRNPSHQDPDIFTGEVLGLEALSEKYAIISKHLLSQSKR